LLRLPLNFAAGSSGAVSRVRKMFDFIPSPLRTRLGGELADRLGELVLLMEPADSRVCRDVHAARP
jgi:hypothetical protein